MNALLNEGSKRFWDDLEREGQTALQDCTDASKAAAATGALTDVTAKTRAVVTGRSNNEHLFYRSTDEAKRRMEVARDSTSLMTVDDLVAKQAHDEQERALHSKLVAAEQQGKLADMTHETRVAVTGRAFPDTLMYRTTDEAQARIKAAHIRASYAKSPPPPDEEGSQHSPRGLAETAGATLDSPREDAVIADTRIAVAPG